MAVDRSCGLLSRLSARVEPVGRPDRVREKKQKNRSRARTRTRDSDDYARRGKEEQSKRSKRRERTARPRLHSGAGCDVHRRAAAVRLPGVLKPQQQLEAGIAGGRFDVCQEGRTQQRAREQGRDAHAPDKCGGITHGVLSHNRLLGIWPPLRRVDQSKYPVDCPQADEGQSEKMASAQILYRQNQPFT